MHAPAAPNPANGTWRVGGGRSWYLLVLLTLTSAVSLLDRQIITILAVDIKRDLGLNDSQIGLLYGTFFAIFNSLFSLPLGRLADDWVRIRQVALSLVSWSLATAACAFATGFASLGLARTAVAIGEAGSAPASSSLIGDVFPPGLRGTVFAISALAAVIGIAMSSALGGIVVDRWNAAFPGGHGWFGLVGWQAAFIVASLPGLLLALLVSLMRDPPRGLADGIASPSEPRPFVRAMSELLPLLPGLSLIHLRRLGAPASAVRRNLMLLGATITGVALLIAISARFGGGALSSHIIQWAVVGFGTFALLSWIQAQRLSDGPAAKVMWGSPTFISILAIAALNNVIIYGVMAWIAPFAVTKYQASLSEIGLRIATAGMTAGVIGTLAGGWIADRARRLHPSGRLWVVLAATVLPVPLAWMTFTAETIEGWSFWFLALSLLLTPWLPCVMATAQDLVLPRMRGTTTALVMLVINIFGMGTGPYLVGLVSDATGDLGRSILSVFLFAPLIWIACLIGIRMIGRDEETLISRARAVGEAI